MPFTPNFTPAEDLARHLDATDPLASYREQFHLPRRPDGSPLHPDYVSQRFRLLVVRSGLPPIRLHDLRHGAATLAHTADADLKTVQDQLGHASIGTTQIYTHLDFQHLARIYESSHPRARRRG